MKKISQLSFLLLPLLVSPIQVMAQSGGINLSAITPYSDGIINLINSIFVPVLFAIVFFTFILGVYRYFILGADNEAERTKGKDFVIWGIIGFVVIIAVWSIVGLVGSTLGLSPGGSAPSYPKL